MKINQKISKNLCKGKISKQLYWYINLNDYPIKELLVYLNEIGLKSYSSNTEYNIVIEPKISFKVVVNVRYNILLRTMSGIFLLLDIHEFNENYIKIKKQNEL